MAAPFYTSGTYSYGPTVYDVICGSLRICGVIADEETPTAAQAANTLAAMAAMVKGWQATGIHVWAEEECLLFPQPQQTSYKIGAGSTDHLCLTDQLVQTFLTSSAADGATTLTVDSIAGLANGYILGVQADDGFVFWTTISGTPSGSTVTLADALTSAAAAGLLVFAYPTALMRVLRVPNGRRRFWATGNETPLIVMSRFDYDNLPNKTTPGIITQFFFDPQQGNGAYTNPQAIMNVWPAPTDYQNGMAFVGQRPIQDISGLTQLPDFPVEWVAALKWGTALEIAPEFDVEEPRTRIIAAQAERWLLLARQWDKEPEPLLFGMAMSPGYR